MSSSDAAAINPPPRLPFSERFFLLFVSCSHDHSRFASLLRRQSVLALSDAFLFLVSNITLFSTATISEITNSPACLASQTSSIHLHWRHILISYVFHTSHTHATGNSFPFNVTLDLIIAIFSFLCQSHTLRHSYLRPERVLRLGHPHCSTQSLSVRPRRFSLGHALSFPLTFFHKSLLRLRFLYHYYPPVCISKQSSQVHPESDRDISRPL